MIRELAAYWHELRGANPVALKKSFDPARVTALLPYLIIAEYVQNPLRIRYRLVGTEQVRHAGEDFTGKWLHETEWDSRYVEVWLAAVAEMITTSQPVFGRDLLLWTDDKIKECEWAVFPMSIDGRGITHGLGIEDFSKIERRRGLFAPL
ncbi:PAS domain-containing protein [Hypericibacter sp.]|uniref:PAS domain-containing protein n=1 Tax=Hypericibacter sp. TaxID=2705401 RepID=UPI003D6D186D